MNHRYRKHYELLGLTPDDAWKQLRDAYKKSVRRWHPDRFQNDDLGRTLAEEKTKAINCAYAELAEYHKKNGELPLHNRHSNATIAPTREHTPPKTSPGACDPASNSPPPRGSHRARESIGPSSRRPVAIIVCVLLIAAFLVYRPLEMAETGADVRIETPPVTPPMELIAAPLRQDKGGAFSVGSSIGEVHSVQGIPSRIEGEVWHYGDARIRFSHGRVISWDDPSGATLRTRPTSDYPQPEPEFFGVGTNKAKVRQIQGAPIRDSGTVWDYGPSRVFFRDEHVIGWHESPLHPLKIIR